MASDWALDIEHDHYMQLLQCRWATGTPQSLSPPAVNEKEAFWTTAHKSATPSISRLAVMLGPAETC